MLAAAHISAARGLMSADDHAQLSDIIRRMGPLPLVTDLRPSDALDVISRDKKVVDGRLHFVLCAGLGASAIVSDVTTAELTAALLAIGLQA